jgi:DNA-binding MarR family transcriptional regulator
MIDSSDIYRSCVCLGVRRAARAVSRRYDEALRPVGITSGQFSLLSGLFGEAGLPLGSLADRMGMDRTTLNRNLKPLEEEGLIDSRAGEDARQRLLMLTPAGTARLEAALPLWAEAQSDSQLRLGPTSWQTLSNQLATLSGSG